MEHSGLVDANALVDALESGEIAGAAIDVLEKEPPADGNPLLDYKGDNLIITPHVGGWTETYLDQVLEAFVENVERVRRGDAPLSTVSREHHY